MAGVLQTVMRNLARAATLLWLIFHFSLTLLWVLPLSPLRMKADPIVRATIGSFFPQNWSLFAPNPVSSTESLLARCLTEDETPKKVGAPLPADHWTDLSQPFFLGSQRHRFSAYERLVRPIQNSLRQYLSGGVDLHVFQESCKKGDHEACAHFEEVLKVRRQEAAVKLRKIASAFCREAYPSRQNYGVALRYRQQMAVPWSERFTASPKTSDYELGVFPIDRGIVLPGLFSRGVD